MIDREITTIDTNTRRRLSVRPGFTLIELLIVAAMFAVAFLLATTVFAGVQSSQRGIAGRQRIVADGRYLLEAMARSVRLGSIDYTFYRDPGNNGTSIDDAVDLTKPARLGAGTPFTNILAVRDTVGNQTCYRWVEATGNRMQTNSGSTNCAGTWTDITPSDIVITKFQVIIRPASDPFLAARTPLDCKVTPTTDGACPCNDASDGDATNDTDVNSCLSQQRCVAQRPGSSDPEICLNVNIQPTVTLVLETKNNTARSGEQSNIILQTTVTPRILRR